ncbi:MAG: histone deacetylase family protein [Nocardioidaceae bacterium]|nr:MAG: histone deacetylase family protein [Nocardioidaceae bacterium]
MGSIPVVWSPQTRLHDPRHEIWVGVATEGTEVAARVDVILAELSKRGYPIMEPSVEADDVLHRVHSSELLMFLRDAARDWAAGPYEELVGQSRVVPYLFPTPAMTAGIETKQAKAIHAEAGRYAYDTMTLVGPGTWEAARAAADCAATAATLVAEGASAAYALCRPPGHHATPAGFGGSCYLNNAAVAAETLRAGGAAKVGILDIDAHQGNGTAAIFYERSDVLYASVHVDPAAGWFPHILGFADETGSGAGIGATRNLPLAEGTGDEVWLEAVAELTTWLDSAGCDALVVSLGVDAAADDPESPLLITHDGYHEAGSVVATLGRPTIVVQEGGYHLPTLGTLVAEFLTGLASLKTRPPKSSCAGN